MMRAVLLGLVLIPGLAFAGETDAVEVAAAQARAAHPELAQAARDLPLARGRNGALRLIGAQADPRVAAIHLDLALNGGLDPDVAAAHAGLAAAGLQDAELMNQALAEGSVQVRAAFLAGLHRSAAPAAGPTLAHGLTDAHPQVREVAASLLGRRPDAATFAEPLAVAARDVTPAVRRLSIRALGWHGVTAKVAVVDQAIDDDDPLVRRTALRALNRLDPARAQVAAKSLQADLDGRVSAAAAQVLGE